jgi:hypothetical protein
VAKLSKASIEIRQRRNGGVKSSSNTTLASRSGTADSTKPAIDGLESFGIQPAQAPRPHDVVAVPEPVISNRLRCAVVREPDFTYFVFRIEGIQNAVTANWVEKLFADAVLQDNKEWTERLKFQKKCFFGIPTTLSSLTRGNSSCVCSISRLCRLP